MRATLPLPLFAVITALPLLGCSRFESDWRSPALQLAPAPETDRLAGRWKGSWKSKANGHGGSLRCITTKLDEDTYRASFHATFGLVFQFDYPVNMDVDHRVDATHFTGQADLGRMAGGVYEYAGHADGEGFYSTYRSRDDHGYFKMKRPK